MRDFINLIKALADQNRVRILMALLKFDELCVCQIVELLKLAPSTVSKHIFILRSARLITGRKSGLWHYYSISKKRDNHLMKILDCIASLIEGCPEIKNDFKKLKKIVQYDLNYLCNQRQRKTKQKNKKMMKKI